jgi:hypothetical protein
MLENLWEVEFQQGIFLASVELQNNLASSSNLELSCRYFNKLENQV